MLLTVTPLGELTQLPKLYSDANPCMVLTFEKNIQKPSHCNALKGACSGSNNNVKTTIDYYYFLKIGQ